MLILPAIDLIDGKCVRLVQGDYAQQTTYADDPLEVALGFAEEGAEWLHLVDLDGAKAGAPVNLEVARRIARESRLKIEFGGGVKSEASLKAALDAGVERVILGSALVKDEAFARQALQLGEQVVCGLDARDRKVMVTGWLEASDADVVTFALKLLDLGARRFIVTDIARDGMLNGPNLDLLREFLDAVDAPVIQSGGVSSPADIEALAAMKIPLAEGVIIGKALYEGRLSVRQAISIASGATSS